MMETITCSRCGTPTPVDGFDQDRSRPTGRHPWCKSCRRSSAQSHRQANPEYHRERNRTYRSTHPGFARAAIERHRAANRDLINERQRARRAASGANNDYQREWRRRHPEHAREMSRRRRAVLAAAAIIGHPTAESIRQRMAYFGNRCWICGGPFEQVDHVKPLSKGGAHCLANLRPSCASCNNRKRARWPLSKEALQSQLSHS